MVSVLSEKFCGIFIFSCYSVMTDMREWEWSPLKTMTITESDRR